MLELTDVCSSIKKSRTNDKMYAATMYMYIQGIDFHADFIYFKYCWKSILINNINKWFLKLCIIKDG